MNPEPSRCRLCGQPLTYDKLKTPVVCPSCGEVNQAAGATVADLHDRPPVPSSGVARAWGLELLKGALVLASFAATWVVVYQSEVPREASGEHKALVGVVSFLIATVLWGVAAGLFRLVRR